MNKNEVVEKMVRIAEEYNILAMQGSNMQEDQIEQMVDQVRPQLYTIQSDIYDLLVKDGLIK
jgi:hypothetical protein